MSKLDDLSMEQLRRIETCLSKAVGAAAIVNEQLKLVRHDGADLMAALVDDEDGLDVAYHIHTGADAFDDFLHCLRRVRALIEEKRGAGVSYAQP